MQREKHIGSDTVKTLEMHLMPTLPVAGVEPGHDFTGIARSIQCFLNNGMFLNFKILTLHIKQGKVHKVEYSDPYASFEALCRMELANELSLMHLNNKWSNGKCLER